MKKTLFVLVVLMQFSFHMSAQTLNEFALVTTIYNEHEDPIINIVDANGARQGDWFYQDNDGLHCVKETYLDHVKTDRFFNFGTNQNPQWTSTFNIATIQSGDVYNQFVVQLKNKVADWNIKQLVVGQVAGQKVTFLLGKWSVEDAHSIKAFIDTYLNAHSNSFNSNFTLYVE